MPVPKIRLLAALCVAAAVVVVVASPASAADLNTAPARTISNGTATPLHAPGGVAVSPDGTIYVYSNTGPAILVFAPGASGSDAPERVITGANTLITTDAGGLALDAAGNLYLANLTSTGGDIVEFAAGANGNATPTRVISGAATTLSEPVGIAIAPNGSIDVAQDGAGAAGILEFASTATGNAAPVLNISGSNTGLGHATGIALQSDGSLVVSNNIDNTINTFAPNASGNVAPRSQIAGSNTLLNNDVYIAVDRAGNIYSSNNVGQSITEYPANAAGNVAPTNRIVGASTGLSQPYGIALDPGSDIIVGNFSADSITVYNPFLTVASIAATSGNTSGGSPVTVTGNGFVTGAMVTIGGVLATDVVVTSPTTLTAVTPAHAAGRVDVSVAEGPQLATLSAAFNFVALLAATGSNPEPLVELAFGLLGVGLLFFVGNALRARRRRAAASR